MAIENAPIRVVQYGLGPIGIETTRAVQKKAETRQVELVGAIDIDPEKVGRDVGDLLGAAEPLGLTVSDEAEQVLHEARPDVVLHTTTSFLDDVQEQLLLCIEAGAHVVSSTEELAFPYERHPERAAELNRRAEEQGVVVLGTGVNPGYAMDALALMATGACTDVAAVRVERVVDASQRRQPLQEKIGATLQPAAFEERKQTGTFGHIGLRESLALVAHGLGWALDRVDETLEPVIADQAHQTPYLSVSQGDVAGIHHAASGYVADQAVLALDLKMYVGAEEEYDAVHVEGEPPIDLVAQGGIFGDTATVGALVNAAGRVNAARPGLRTVTDLPLPRAFATTPIRQPSAKA